MGNATSDVTNNVKAQADAHENPTYKLVDVKGGGELIKLMKEANLNKNVVGLDEKIKTLVQDMLYNRGKGENISINQLVLERGGHKVTLKKQMNTSNLALNLLKLNDKKKSIERNVCWRIEKRGAVGETPLHLCLLNASALHNDLARRLVKLFPNLVNDIYLSDEYYGEAALHMAIVNEDPCMVYFLLSHGADVHQRCCGKFFYPDDQKKGLQDSLTQECPISPLKTNYVGYSYFGEYPLSFAAIMDQEDCVRLLIAKKADSNKQDSNGNTVLHMLVIHNKLNMFCLMLEFGARLDIKNRLGYTPLSLAAKLARKDIFLYILKRMRNVYWVYTDISCAAYPLANIDTIREDGTFDSDSVLYSIVNGHTDDHLELLNGVLLNLMQKKWKTFLKKKFFIQFFSFVAFFILVCLTVILKRDYFVYLRHESVNCTSTIINSTNDRTYLIDECKCAYLQPTDSNRWFRTTIELIVLVISIVYLSLAIAQFIRHKYRLFLRTLKEEITRVIFLISCLMIIIIAICRLSCAHMVEDHLVVLTTLCLSTHFLYFFRGFRVLGSMTLIITNIIKVDVMRYLLIYFVFMMGFSQALFIVFQYGNVDESTFSTPFESLMDVFIISLGEIGDYYVLLEKSPYQVIGKILLIVYIVVVSLLLVNMLIAMMADTYAIIAEKKTEPIRQWAKLMLSIEQSISIKELLKNKNKYSHVFKNSERAFVVQWKQSEAEREYLKSRKDIFREQIRNIKSNTN